MSLIQKKKARRKTAIQLIAFCLCLVLIGGTLGGVIVGAIFSARGSAAAVEETTEPPRYGTRDGKSITEDGAPSFVYVAGEGFTPLECKLPEELQEYTYYLCQAYYIDFEFVMAVMYKESSFRADVISGTSDYGLMQINKCNHATLTDALGITDFTDPYQNIHGGIYLLRGLFEKYEDPALVCMAYNLGEYGASVLWNKGVYETSYSRKVLSVADEYEAQRGGTDV